MSSPAHTTKREVFQRILDKLKIGFQGTDYANRIYLVIGTDLPVNIKDRDFLILRVGGGQFDDRIFGASGPAVVRYNCTATVEVYQNNRQDRSGTSDVVLLRDSTGLLDVEQTILSTLTGTLLETTDKPFEGILVEQMRPMEDSEPMRDSEEAFEERGNTAIARAVVSVTFNVAFHWQL